MKLLYIAYASGILLLAFIGFFVLKHDIRSQQEDQITAISFSTDPDVSRLAIALEKHNREDIAVAIQRGANVNACGTAGYRMLDWAMSRRNVRGFEALLEQGARLDALYKDPRITADRSYNATVLERVLAADSDDFIRAAIRSGIPPDHVPFSRDGRSMIFFAANAGRTSVVDALLDSGATIDYRSNDGRNVLFDAMLARNYGIAWQLLKRGADPTVKNNRGHDFVWGLKEWGSRGVRPEHRESFEAIVDELVRRGLLTRQDIVEADKPKQPAAAGKPGITVIEHAPDSEAGRAIQELDRLERDSIRRNR